MPPEQRSTGKTSGGRFAANVGNEGVFLRRVLLASFRVANIQSVSHTFRNFHLDGTWVTRLGGQFEWRTTRRGEA